MIRNIHLTEKRKVDESSLLASYIISLNFADHITPSIGPFVIISTILNNNTCPSIHIFRKLGTYHRHCNAPDLQLPRVRGLSMRTEARSRCTKLDPSPGQAPSCPVQAESFFSCCTIRIETGNGRGPHGLFFSKSPFFPTLQRGERLPTPRQYPALEVKQPRCPANGPATL